MADARRCERCGRTLGAFDPVALCAACMLQDGLDAPAGPSPGPAGRLPDDLPRSLGNYELLEELGRGGMGIVYLAEQKEPVRRRVAVKVIKLGMDTREVIARFEAERQALALMDHANIARIFDAGATDAGRPYFVMELVPGVKITEYCDRHKLSTSDRLKLFVQVCGAIQHAHQKGVVHRDIKPSNILVAEQDGVAVPKIIDFGVAKAAGPLLTEKTVFTAFQQIIGTPAYMSPEQAELGGRDVDTRTDIYSLGVLLYEMLTGQTPFDSRDLLSAGLDAMRRKIREEEPQRPSTRLTSLTNEELTSVAQRRQAEPPKLVRLVRGDLDWIVMKAIEKERSRRYETTNSLALDVQRYLKNEAILARPATRRYRLQKFVRRHKLAFAAAIAVILALVGGVVASAWQAAIATGARNEAKANEAKAQQVTKFLTGMFERIDPALAKHRDITVREVLDEAGRTIGTAFSNQPQTEVAIRRTLAEIYGKLGRDDQALPYAEGALLLARSISPRKDSLEVAAALNAVGDSLDALGRSSEALPKHEEALAIYQRIHRGDHSDVVESLNHVAFCLDALGRSTEALAKLETASAMAQRLHPGDDPDVAESLNNQASILDNLGRPAEALPKYQAALEIRRRLYPGDHPDVVTSLSNVATCLDALGRGTEALTNYEAALAMAQRIYKGDHPYVATSLNNLAACLSGQGRSAEALPHYEAALAMRRRMFPGDHPYVATSLNNAASCLEALGRSPEAAPKYAEAGEMYERIYKGDHPQVALGLENLASCLDSMGRSPEALPKHEAALAMRRRVFPGDHPAVASSLNSLGRCLESLRRPTDALPNFESALAMLRRIHKEDHPDLIQALNNLGLCLEHLGRPVDALPNFESALEMSRRLSKADSPYIAACEQNRGHCRAALGQSNDALEDYQGAIAMFNRLMAGNPGNAFVKLGLAKTHDKMGDLLKNLGQGEQAAESFKKGLALSESFLAFDPSNVQAAELRNTLRSKLGLNGAK